MQVSDTNCWGSVSEWSGRVEAGVQIPHLQGGTTFALKALLPNAEEQKKVSALLVTGEEETRPFCVLFQQQGFYSKRKVWFLFCSLKKKETEDFPCGPVVKTVLTMQGAQVQFLPWN